MKNWFKDVGFIIFVIPILGYFLSYISFLMKLDYYNINITGDSFNIFDNLEFFLYLILFLIIFMPFIFIKYQLINFYKGNNNILQILFFIFWYIAMFYILIKSRPVIEQNILILVSATLIVFVIICGCIYKCSESILEKFYFEEYKEFIFQDTNKALDGILHNIKKSDNKSKIRKYLKIINYTNFHSKDEVKEIYKLIEKYSDNKSKIRKYLKIIIYTIFHSKDEVKEKYSDNSEKIKNLIKEIRKNNTKFYKKIDKKIKNTLIYDEFEAIIILIIIIISIIYSLVINDHIIKNNHSYVILNTSIHNDNILLNQAICDSKYDKLVVVHETSENIYLQCGAIDGKNLIINTFSYYVTNKVNQSYYYKGFKDVEIYNNLEKNIIKCEVFPNMIYSKP